MTNRERIVKTLLCEKTDRAPWVWWLGFQPWGVTDIRWKQESGLADLDVRKYFELETFFHVPPAHMGPVPSFDWKVFEEADEYTVSLDWRGITTRNWRDNSGMPEYISHPVKSPADWAEYKEKRLQRNQLQVRLPDVKKFAAEAAAAGAPVQLGCFPWGMFGTARDVLGVEYLLVAFYDEPDMVRDIMQTYTTIWLDVYEEIVKVVPVDHIHIWEDMSGKQGSLISMAMIHEFMGPEYDRVAAFARRHNIPVLSVDTDGQVEQLIPAFLQHGVNAMMPFEVQAGNDVVAYRRQYPKLGIMGGLDKSALAKGKPEMHRELDRAEQMLALGGWVPGFDHLIPPDASWANFKYFMEQLKKMIFASTEEGPSNT